MTNIKRKEEVKKEIADILTDPNTGQSYNRGKFLGKGGFARCYELTDPITKKIYAGKIVSKSLLTKQHQKEKMTQEISIHRSLNHKHIVGFHKFFEDSENVYIILELCRRRSLMEFHKRRKAVTEPETRYFLRQLLLGVKHLHDFKVIHRDLKLGNLFINDEMELKIGDFGLATKVGFEGERKRTLCGTPNYIAPEILCKKGHSYEVDVWSIGCILYTLLVGKPPFETQTLKETYTRIKKNEYHIPSRIGPLARNLIQRLLQEDPCRRPSVEDILKDDFMTLGFIPSRLPTSCLTMAPRFDAHLNGSIVATRKPLLELNSKGVGNFLGEREGYNCPYGKMTFLKAGTNAYTQNTSEACQFSYQNVMAENENFESFYLEGANLNENIELNDTMTESETEITRNSNGAQLSHIFERDFLEAENMFEISKVSAHPQDCYELDLLSPLNPSVSYRNQLFYDCKNFKNMPFVKEIMNVNSVEQCTILQKNIPTECHDKSSFSLETKFVHLQLDPSSIEGTSTSVSSVNPFGLSEWMNVSPNNENFKEKIVQHFITSEAPIVFRTNILSTQCRSKDYEMLDHFPSYINSENIDKEASCENEKKSVLNNSFRKRKIDLFNFKNKPEDTHAEPGSSQYIMSNHRLSSQDLSDHSRIDNFSSIAMTYKSDAEKPEKFKNLIPMVISDHSDDEYIAATTLLEMNSGWSQSSFYNNEHCLDSVVRSGMFELGNKSDSLLDITGISVEEPCSQKYVCNPNDKLSEYSNNLSMVSKVFAKDHCKDPISLVSKASKENYLSFNSNTIEEARTILGAVAVGSIYLSIQYSFCNDSVYKSLSTKNFYIGLCTTSDTYTEGDEKLFVDLHSFLRSCKIQGKPQISFQVSAEQSQELDGILKSIEEAKNIVIIGNARRKLQFLSPSTKMKDPRNEKTGKKIILHSFGTPMKTNKYWSRSANEIACNKKPITSTPFQGKSEFTISMNVVVSSNKIMNSNLNDQDKYKQLDNKFDDLGFNIEKTLYPLSDFVSFNLGCQSAISCSMLYSSLSFSSKDFYSDESCFYSLTDFWITGRNLSISDTTEWEQREDTLSPNGLKKINYRNQSYNQHFETYCDSMSQNGSMADKFITDSTVSQEFFKEGNENLCDDLHSTIPFADIQLVSTVAEDFNALLSRNCCLDEIKLTHGKENSFHKIMQSCFRLEMGTDVLQAPIMMPNERYDAGCIENSASQIFELSTSNLDFDLENFDCNNLQEILLDDDSFLNYFYETDKSFIPSISSSPPSKKTDLQTSWVKRNNYISPDEFGIKKCKTPSTISHNDSAFGEKIPKVKCNSMKAKKSLFKKSRRDRKNVFKPIDCSKGFTVKNDVHTNLFSESCTPDSAPDCLQEILLDYDSFLKNFDETDRSFIPSSSSDPLCEKTDLQTSWVKRNNYILPDEFGIKKCKTPSTVSHNDSVVVRDKIPNVKCNSMKVKKSRRDRKNVFIDCSKGFTVKSDIHNLFSESRTPDSLQEILLDDDSFLNYFDETDKNFIPSSSSGPPLQTSWVKRDNYLSPDEFGIKKCKAPSTISRNDSVVRDKIPKEKCNSTKIKKSLFNKSRRDRKNVFIDCSKGFTVKNDVHNWFSESLSPGKNLIEKAGGESPATFKSPFAPDFYSTPFSNGCSFPFKWDIPCDTNEVVAFNCTLRSVAMPEDFVNPCQSKSLSQPKNKRSSVDFPYCKRLKTNHTEQYSWHSVSSNLSTFDKELSEQAVWTVKRKPVLKALNMSGRPKLILKFKKVVKEK